MILEVSSTCVAGDWYVGEIYQYIIQQFIEKYPNIQFKITDNKSFSLKYGIDIDVYKNSIANIYNLLIYNPENNKLFVNSLNDYAPCCLMNGTGVEKFNLVGFGCVSNHNQYNIDTFKSFNLIPSFYILENMSDLERIKKYKSKPRKYNYAYFLGLLYGRRNEYFEIFKDSNLVKINNKNNDWKNRDDYFDTLSDYNMSFSMDGAALICHRDIESLGIGNILIREHLDVKMYDPLLPNIHYVEIITKKEKETMHLNQCKELIINRIEDFINDNKLVSNYLNECENWFNRNCTPINQFKIIDNITNNLELLR
jgi:hypothetical protein